MKVSMFTKEEMHADQAEFRLLVLISKYARDPWRRSLTSQTDHWSEWRMRRVFTINRSATKMPRECAAVGCAELQTKGSLFSFHTFPKDSSRRQLHPWRFELEIVPSRLPCGQGLLSATNEWTTTFVAAIRAQSKNNCADKQMESQINPN